MDDLPVDAMGISLAVEDNHLRDDYPLIRRSEIPLRRAVSSAGDDLPVDAMGINFAAEDDHLRDDHPLMQQSEIPLRRAVSLRRGMVTR